MRAFVTLVAVVLAVALGTAPSQAFVIDFVGLSGGTVSYAGGTSPLIGTNLPISQVFGVPPGSSSITGVTGGDLDFATGPLLGSFDLSGDAFMNFYGSGGSLTLTGGVPAAGITPGSTLLQAAFAGPATLSYSGFGLASLVGSLSLLYVNPDLTEYFGFGSDPTYYLGPGSIAQAQLNISFPGGTVGPGLAFTGQQASVNLTATVPQPAPLVFLGMGMIGVAAWARVQRVRRGRSAPPGGRQAVN
ncbi:MAG TPA: hypothetical protein VNO52_03180 [Methylomirabilota bacterium]|nr:hypothetical protein [Methylomirabilota bacterium]